MRFASSPRQARRLATADQDNVETLWNLGCRVDQQCVERALGQHLLTVVQNEHRRPRQSRVQLPEETPAETGEIGQMLRGQQRKGFLFPRRGFGSR